MKFGVGGYLLKPIEKDDLLTAVANVGKRIQLKLAFQKNQRLLQSFSKEQSHDQLIGVPTMDGLDFLPIQDIIRCEGLQRCTRIVTKSNCNIISSYNLGQFKKLLEPFGFFASHRSFLINLHYVKKYLREGTIIMSDEKAVPISEVPYPILKPYNILMISGG